jgi:hypothetical protein
MRWKSMGLVVAGAIAVLAAEPAAIADEIRAYVKGEKTVA